MSPLNTTNPIALQILMSETIFGIDFPEKSIENPEETLSQENDLGFEADQPEIIIKSLGGNQKKILFFIEDPKNDFFSKDAELAFVKTLKALKLSFADIAIINYEHSYSKITFDQIKKEFAPNACIFLGFEPERLGLKNCAENIWASENDVQVLNSFSFEEMLNDIGKKRIFWDAIKLMNF